MEKPSILKSLKEKSYRPLVATPPRTLHWVRIASMTFVKMISKL